MRPAGSALLRCLVFVVAVATVGCDHATKSVAKAELAGAAPVHVIDGIVKLRYVKNDDLAFSLLHALSIPRSPAVLGTVSVLALIAIALVWIGRRRNASPWHHVAFAFVVAGAIGNVVDRLSRGYVVDFIDVRGWPVFNVADIAVVVGGGIFALLALRDLGRPPGNAPKESPASLPRS